MFRKRDLGFCVSVASFCALLYGCAAAPNARQAMRLSEPDRSGLPGMVDAQSDPEPDGLSKVAQFLARTAEYQLAASQSNATAKDASLESSAEGAAPKTVERLGNESQPLNGVRQALRFTGSAVPQRREPVLALPVVKAVTVAYRATKNLIETAPVAPKPVVMTRRNAVNQPLSIPARKRQPEPEWTVDSVLSRLEREAMQSGDLDSVWPLKFAQLAFHRDSQAAEMPQALASPARGILGALMRFVPTIRGMARDASTSGNEALARLDEMRNIVADRADPVVSTIALCRTVVTFGVYDEIASTEFIAGRENQAIVYSEIRNLRAQRSDKGRYVSRLGTRLEVLTVGGQSMWQQEQPEIVDESRNRRTDFFVAERIALPATLPSGNYVLKVMVQDKLSDRMHEASMPFTIGSTQRVAPGLSDARRLP